MKFKGTLIAAASGSIGGLTFSHNRGGQYIRARTTPVDPGSAFQVLIRGYMSTLTSRWNNILTAAQRAAWDNYAEQVPVLDSLGEPRNMGGLGAYCGSNVPRLQASLPYADAAPTVFNRGEYTTPAIASITAPTSLSLTFTEADAWVGEDDAGMVILGSNGYNPSINFFKGPYRFAGVILGDSGTPPTSPAAITLPFPLTAGQKAFIQGRVLRADGRWSAPFRLSDTVAA